MDQERSLISVTESGCHEWLGSQFPSGYGRLKIGPIGYRVHRVVWELAKGPIPEGLVVMHKCDNRLCVRLSHLRLGTPRQNIDDMLKKGRSLKGARNHKSKLSDQDVAEIRKFYEEAEATQTAIAEVFGVSQAIVSKIVRGLHRP